ncbi:MAG TPA: hypothetical protein VK761_08120, partial [Solirubrobacteraceae bacterium]|nr:hypothetical protein [Solirubrobacteraceae bacterium]
KEVDGENGMPLGLQDRRLQGLQSAEDDFDRGTGYVDTDGFHAGDDDARNDVDDVDQITIRAPGRRVAEMSFSEHRA